MRQVVTKTRVAIFAIAGAVAGVTGWYSGFVRPIQVDRQERLDRVDAMISALRHDSSPTSRVITFDSLRGRTIADHLEPHAIRGLLGFVRGERRIASACVPPGPSVSPDTLAIREDVARALRAIRELQVRQRRAHGLSDRLTDWAIAKLSPDLVEPPEPISLDDTDLRGADLTELDLRRSSFRRACLVGATLDSTTLDSASFERAILRSASLRGARGVDVRFDRADLVDVDLSGAALRRASFLGSTLSCATLGNVRLDSAYLSGAIANWTFFGGATLDGAERWHEVIGFRGAYLGEVRGLPDSLARTARERGAAPDTISQIAWNEARKAQLRPGGLCAVGRD